MVPAQAKISSGAIEVEGNPPSSSTTVTSILSNSPSILGGFATHGGGAHLITLHSDEPALETAMSELNQGPAGLIRRMSPTRLAARAGRDDVAGFVVVGQPFASGDLLCLRSFPASSFGPGYVSVWHRNPAGEWTVYTSIAGELSCPRFISAAAVKVLASTPITVEWNGPSALTVRVPAAGLEWRFALRATLVTRMMNMMMSLMPGWMFRNNAILSMMGLMSTAMLAAGRMQLAGHVPNGQWFQAGPRRVWLVGNASATLGGRDLGRPAPFAAQAMLGDVPMPQRGVVMAGAFSFEAYQPGQHRPPVAGMA